MASKIKIKIFESESNRNINLPAIPFWLLNSIISIGLRTKRYWLNDERLSKKQLEAFKTIDKKDIKQFIKEIKRELKEYEKFDLFDISTSDGTSIKISVL